MQTSPINRGAWLMRVWQKRHLKFKEKPPFLWDFSRSASAENQTPLSSQPGGSTRHRAKKGQHWELRSPAAHRVCGAKCQDTWWFGTWFSQDKPVGHTDTAHLCHKRQLAGALTSGEGETLSGGIEIPVGHDLIFCWNRTMISQEYKNIVARRAREENDFWSLGIRNFIWRTGGTVLTTEE